MVYMFCTNCGKHIEDDVIYCNYCGHRVETTGQEPKEKTTGQIDSGSIDIKEPKEKTTGQIDSGSIDIKEISKGLYLFLSTVCTVASFGNIVGLLMRGERYTNSIIGQATFLLIFIVSIILLLKSRKIGGAILISFVLFKMVSSLYYYYWIHYEYLMKNLIIDEVLYLVIILSLIVNWKTLK